jgi:hypothetical protein
MWAWQALDVRLLLTYVDNAGFVEDLLIDINGGFWQGTWLD